MNAIYKLVGLCLLAATTVGCAGMGTPNLCNAGSARDQRARANFYDPYASADYGPAIPEARPRGFDRPFAPPLQTQLERWSSTRQQSGP